LRRPTHVARANTERARRWHKFKCPHTNSNRQVHEALCFDARSEAWHTRRNFGIWSIKWSGDGREIIAGTNDERVYVYDVEVGLLVVVGGVKTGLGRAA
jgi:WD40 repeat protein